MSSFNSNVQIPLIKVEQRRKSSEKLDQITELKFNQITNEKKIVMKNTEIYEDTENETILDLREKQNLENLSKFKF